jgi:hypothetical protein
MKNCHQKQRTAIRSKTVMKNNNQKQKITIKNNQKQKITIRSKTGAKNN